MAFKFRKSINLGGFRINLSKSGIGYSFGVKGFRFTHKAGGGSRTTVGIPGTGLSYVKDRSASKSVHTQKNAKTPSEFRRELPAPKEEEPDNEIVGSSPNEMIDRLNRADKLDSVFRVCRVVFPLLGFLCICVFFAIVSNGMTLTFETGEKIDGTAWAIVCAILAAIFIGAGIFFLMQKIKIDLSYDFSEDANFERQYSELLKGLAELQTIAKIWEIGEEAREKAEVSFAPLEAYIETDLEIKTVKLLHKKLLFLPDIVAVKQQGGWAGVPYTEVGISLDIVPTEEREAPADANILSQRWLHARKDGGRDGRYRDDNYLIYRCAYGELTLSFGNNAHMGMLCSSDEKAQAFRATLAGYIEFMRS